MGFISPPSGVTMPWRSASASLPVAISYWSRLVDQRRHRVRRRAVHPDLAVPVEGHESPRRVDQWVDDGEIEVVDARRCGPVVDAGAAEWVGADAHAGAADGVEVEHRRQVVDIGAAVVVAMCVVGCQRPGQRHPPDAAVACGEQLVGARGDPTGGVGVGRAAVGRVVLEAAVLGRVVRRRDDDAVGEIGPARGPRAVSVVAEDGVRDRRGRRVAVVGVDEHGDVVGREDLERGRPRRLGQGVGVTPEEQRSVDRLHRPGTRRSPAWSPRCGPR